MLRERLPLRKEICWKGDEKERERDRSVGGTVGNARTMYVHGCR